MACPEPCTVHRRWIHFYLVQKELRQPLGNLSFRSDAVTIAYSKLEARGVRTTLSGPRGTSNTGWQLSLEPHVSQHLADALLDFWVEPWERTCSESRVAFRILLAPSACYCRRSTEHQKAPTNRTADCIILSKPALSLQNTHNFEAYTEVQIRQVAPMGRGRRPFACSITPTERPGRKSCRHVNMFSKYQK